MSRRRLIFACGAIPAIVAAVLALWRPAFINPLDNAVYDALLRQTGARPPDSRIVIVDVDERSLATIGQWPWRRDRIGRLIARLRDMGAATIALDIIFAEPDRYEGVVNAEDTAAAGRQATPDALLAESLGQGRVVLGYGMTFEENAATSNACILHPVSVAMLDSQDNSEDAPFFQATGAICNLPVLSRAAGSSGFLNAAPDSDGILRRIPVLIQLNGGIYPSLALSAVAALTDKQRELLAAVRSHLLALQTVQASFSSAMSIDAGRAAIVETIRSAGGRIHRPNRRGLSTNRRQAKPRSRRHRATQFAF